MTKASAVFKKKNFSKKKSFKCIRKRNLTLTFRRSTLDHHLNNLGRAHIPTAIYQVPRSSAFWFLRRFLKGFYHIWAWRPSWSCDQDHLNKLSFPPPKESPFEIEINWPSGFRGENI